MIQQFNKYHLSLLACTIAVIIILCIVFALFLRNKKRVTYWVIFGLLAAGFVIHFLRLLVLPKDREFPFAFSYITPMGVCAVNAMVFPFFYLFRSKMLKDYMFYIGILTGFLALVTPLTAIGKPALSFDVIRFFVLHGLLCCAPLLMVLCGHHRLSWRRTWQPAWVLTAVLCVITVNELVLFASGILGEPYDLHTLVTGKYVGRNGAMIFGPPEDAGIYAKFFTALCPNTFKKALFDIEALGIQAGDKLYWPLVWIIIPGVVYFTILCFLLSLIFDAKRFWRDMRYAFYTITQQIDKRDNMPKNKLSRIKR